MKTMNCIVCAITMLLCISCKTTHQFVACEDITSTSERSWLTDIVQTGVSLYGGAKLISIDKIIYSVGSETTTYTGFDVIYETVCCDFPNEYIYNCEGEIIANYGGGWADCSGQCDIVVHSKTNIYKAR